MQIGRRIYYELATGNVIQDTGERSGTVIETTIEQDFSSFTALKERSPETVGVIQLEYGQYREEFTQYSLLIDPVSHELLWLPPSNGTFEDVKAQKLEQLNSFCNTTILAGFTSSALGTPHSYDFDYDAQINLGGMMNAITAGIVTESFMWKASGAPQLHTLDQFKTVFADGLAHKNALIARYWTLKDAVLAAETAEEIDAIVW